MRAFIKQIIKSIENLLINNEPKEFEVVQKKANGKCPSIKFHSNLAKYFDKQGNYYDRNAELINIRKLSELLWQLTKLEDWELLKKRITDIEFFNLLWEKKLVELRYTLQLLTSKLETKLWILYKHLIDDQNIKYEGINLASILIDFGYSYYASEILSRIQSNTIGKKASKIRLRMLKLAGKAHFQRGNYWISLDAFEDLLRHSGKINDKVGLITSYNYQAKIYLIFGELEKADKLLKLGYSILCNFKHNLLMIDNLIIQFNYAFKLNENLDYIYDSISSKIKGVIDPELEDELLLISGLYFIKSKDFPRAESYLNKYQSKCRLYGNLDKLQNCLGYEALIQIYKNNINKAFHILEEKEHLCYEISSAFGLQETRGLQSIVCMKKREYKKALKLVNVKKNICNEHSYALDYKESIIIENEILSKTKN